MKTLAKVAFGVVGFFVLIAVLTAIVEHATEQSAPTPRPAVPAPNTPVISPEQRAATAHADEIARRESYIRTLESHLLSLGLDAHVTGVGNSKTTLRISWAGMSRPVVYNMINGDGMRLEVPALGFTKVIFTDDGSFSGNSDVQTWTYRWTGQQWKP